MKKIISRISPNFIKQIYKIVNKTNFAGRELDVYDSDVFLVSYPKSGNTWARFLIGNLVNETNVDFENIEKVIPDIYLNTNKDLNKIKKPRIIKSHEFYDDRYKKAVIFTRDPRDVAVSYWHFSIKQKHIDKNTKLDEFVHLFIDGKLNKFKSWSENIESWLKNNTDNRYLFIRYEDMLTNPKNELKKISSYLNIHKDDETIKRAIHNSSFEKMKEKEVLQKEKWKAIQNSRNDIPFIRSGQSGQWKTELSENSIQLIENAWKKTMSKIGYF